MMVETGRFSPRAFARSTREGIKVARGDCEEHAYRHCNPRQAERLAEKVAKSSHCREEYLDDQKPIAACMFDGILEQLHLEGYDFEFVELRTEFLSLYTFNGEDKRRSARTLTEEVAAMAGKVMDNLRYKRRPCNDMGWPIDDDDMTDEEVAAYVAEQKARKEREAEEERRRAEMLASARVPACPSRYEYPDDDEIPF